MRVSLCNSCGFLLAGGVVLTTVLLFGCQSAPTEESPTSMTARFTDPFTYCAAVGTIDAPDARYTGPPMPESVARGLKNAFGSPADAPLDSFLKNSFWRCMDGKVYACTVGANLPCQEKVDTSRTPNEGMVTFCRDTPDADVIPHYAAGSATAYEWRCTNGAPAVVREIVKPDARGFLSNIWSDIKPE